MLDTKSKPLCPSPRSTRRALRAGMASASTSGTFRRDFRDFVANVDVTTKLAIRLLATRASGPLFPPSRWQSFSTRAGARRRKRAVILYSLLPLVRTQIGLPTCRCTLLTRCRRVALDLLFFWFLLLSITFLLTSSHDVLLKLMQQAIRKARFIIAPRTAHGKSANPCWIGCRRAVWPRHTGTVLCTTLAPFAPAEPGPDDEPSGGHELDQSSTQGDTPLGADKRPALGRITDRPGVARQDTDRPQPLASFVLKGGEA